MLENRVATAFAFLLCLIARGTLELHEIYYAKGLPLMHSPGKVTNCGWIAKVCGFQVELSAAFQ